jgi:hypothetical protein
MRKLFLYTCFSVITLLPFYSCNKVDSGDLEEDVPYHQSYSVYFDGSNNTTRGSASFRVRTSNGTGITLSEESSLLINNNIATKEPLISAFVPVYAWEGTSITNVTFKLNKKGGTTFVNMVNTSDIDPVAFPPGMPGTFSKTNGINFSIAGTAGSIEVIVSGQNFSGTDTSLTRTITNNQVSISSTELNIFEPGAIEIQMTRYKSAALQSSDGNAGGGIDITYRVHNSFTLNN